MSEHPHILLFDGVCNLCNGLVRFVIRNDPAGKFSFASLQSPAGQKLLVHHGLPSDDFDSFVYIKKGKAYTKSAAAIMALRELGGIWKLSYPLILLPAGLRNLWYDAIAKTRYRLFGKRNKCLVPASAVRSRFLN